MIDIEKDEEISNLKNANNKDVLLLKEKYKKNIEQDLVERNLVEFEKKKEKEIQPESKSKTLKRINLGDIEPNMTLKSIKRSSNKRYNYKN